MHRTLRRWSAHPACRRQCRETAVRFRAEPCGWGQSFRLTFEFCYRPRGEEKDTLAVNHMFAMERFIQWTWGTYVSGEAHRQLKESDHEFSEGNGTTYAVTKSSAIEDSSGDMVLDVDIRYAIGHHENPWDGWSEGFLEGDNRTFAKLFGNLVSEFSRLHSGYPYVSGKSKTIFAPDIRLPDTNPFFGSVNKAFEEVMGYSSPRFAIGGGSDGKGYTFLLGMGPLFAPNMGYPINYHGIKEGAPLSI